MGVSFKVSRNGKRFKPKPSLQPDSEVVEDENGGDGSRIAREDDAKARKLPGSVAEGAGKGAGMLGSFPSSDLEEREVSFTVNVFRDGYSIGKPSENDMVHQSAIQDVLKTLHPYDRASETMFSDIESGLLPCDILDDIPCKFTDGTLVCEVRDYRKCASEPGSGSLTDRSPIVNKVCLKMTLENLVKDIPMISDNSWAYGDVIELESMVLKALQPRLLLEPTPTLDRLCKNTAPRLQLGLGLGSMRRKRMLQIPEVTVTCNGKTHGKKVCIDRVSEGSNGRLGDSGVVPEHAPENLANNMAALRANGFVQDASLMAQHLATNQANYQMGINNTPRIAQDHVSTGQDLMNSFVSKRENLDGPMSPLSNFNNKRARPMPVGLEGPMGQHMDNFRSDSTWKSTLLQSQAMGRGTQYANTGNQKFSQQVFDGVLNQDVRYAKEEQVETANKLEGSDMQMVESEAGHHDPQQPKHQQRLPQNAYMRSNFPQTPWNNLAQHAEKDGRKEEQLPRRKPVQSPRVSAGTLVHSPLSSKSGEFSTGSAGPHFGTQKEKAAISGPMASSDAMQRQHQAQHPPVKRRSNSANKNSSMAAVGSPASVSNVASPSLGTQSVDKDVLERFSKIEMVALRHQLNRKKKKGDEYIRKPKVHAAHIVGESLSCPDNNEDDKEVEKPLSKSVGGGSMNVCKTRVMTVVYQERVLQGNSVTYVPKVRSRMIMSEKPGDGTVAMLYGDVEQGDFHSVEDHLLTLPNTHIADLLAKQFITLVEHEGYTVQRHVEIRQPRVNTTPAIQPNNPGMEMQLYGEAVPNQAPNEGAKPTNGGNPSFNSSQNPLANSRMLPPGTTQALQMSQGLLNGVSMPPRQHLPDSQSSLSQHQQQQNQLAQQQQHSQFQRSMMLAANPLANLNSIGQSNPNMQLGNHMVNKSALQLQLLHQQQQQQQQQNQQQPQMHRKMMMGLGNMGNNMTGIPSLGNTMTMGNTRGVGGTGISAPIPGMGNVAQNPMNMNNSASNIGNAISQHIRSGTLAPVIMASKLRNMQTRGTMLGGPQQNIAGIPGSRQLHPNTAGLSVLGHTLNRANNMSPMQRASMGPMAPPKLMGGMNMYMNPQQQQQLQMQQQQQQQQQQHLQQQQQLQLQQLQQQHQHQQESGSSPQVGSPSAMGMQQMTQQQAQLQQQASPQQMAQRTPMSPQMSAGAVHAMSAGNTEGCPASPQLSSQTLGSVANSPMDLQGVNKSN